MGTIVMTGSRHNCCFNVESVAVTGSHHGNKSDDWKLSWE